MKPENDATPENPLVREMREHHERRLEQMQFEREMRETHTKRTQQLANPNMTVAELLQLHLDTSNECREIMRRKNSDYTGGETVDDPFANFNMSETFGIDPILGILLRVGDKMRRIQSFARDGGLKVAGESVMDACNDIVNYAILIKGMCVERARKAAAKQTYATDIPVRITDPENYGHPQVPDQV